MFQKIISNTYNIPGDFVGYILGCANHRINTIRAINNTEIDILRGVATIKGTKEAVKATKKMLDDIIHHGLRI